MRIRVTQKDIDEGVRRSGCCPIAQSLKRRGFTDVFVGSSGRAWLGKHWVVLPPAARFFILFFDNAVTVKPFSFTLPRLK